MLDVQVFRSDSTWIAPEWTVRCDGAFTWLWVRRDPGETVQLAVAMTAVSPADPEQMAAVPADALVLMAAGTPVAVPETVRSGRVSALARAATRVGDDPLG